MTTARDVHLLRRRVGWIGFSCLLLAAIFVLDGLGERLGQKFNTIEILAGESTDLTGPMPAGSEALGDLRVTSDTEGINVSFEGIFSGFWLGGAMWKAKLNVDPRLKNGTYSFAVHGRSDAPPPSLAYSVRVFENKEAMNRASYSISRRFLSANPFVLAGTSFFLALLILCWVYLLSSRLEKALADSGQSEVFMVKAGAADDGGDIIAFSLGSRHGVSPGDSVSVAATSLTEVAPTRTVEAVVVSVRERESLARVPEGTEVKPGHIVTVRRQGQGEPR